MCFGSLCKDEQEDQPQNPGPRPAQPQASYAPHPVMQSNSPSLGRTDQITRAAVDVFLSSQKDDGEMGGIGYWQTANAYHAIVLHEAYAGPRILNDKILPAMDKVQQRIPNFINEFNDDTLWWAHCLLALQPLMAGTPREGWVMQNLHAIYGHVSRYQLPPGRHFLPGDGGRSHDMAGAVMWTSKPDEEQVNSITTGLFATLAARLALLAPADPYNDPDRRVAHPYMAAAEAGVGWIFRECYREGDQVVLDAVKIRSGERVDWTFTYTTAATISALVSLATAYREIPSWGKQANANGEMAKACTLATAAMHRDQWVDTETGILTEKGAYGRGSHDPWQNNDAVVFKSVLIRSLCELRQAIVRQELADFRPVADEIDRFVKKQFDALQERDTNGQGQYGPWWDGPFEAPTGHSQLAVLDVMAAAHCIGYRL